MYSVIQEVLPVFFRIYNVVEVENNTVQLLYNQFVFLILGRLNAFFILFSLHCHVVYGREHMS